MKRIIFWTLVLGITCGAITYFTSDNSNPLGSGLVMGIPLAIIYFVFALWQEKSQNHKTAKSPITMKRIIFNALVMGVIGGTIFYFFLGSSNPLRIGLVMAAYVIIVCLSFALQKNKLYCQNSNL